MCRVHMKRLLLSLSIIPLLFLVVTACPTCIKVKQTEKSPVTCEIKELARSKSKSFVDCWPNGYPKTYVDYQDNGTTKLSKTTYYESNGNKKILIYYKSDGVRLSSKHTYYKSNGEEKTLIVYEADGVTIHGVRCNKTDGRTEEPCHPVKHALDPMYMNVTYYDSPANRKLRSYTQYKNTDKTKKEDETTYYKSNGNRKTYIYYQPNGVKKSSQETYYESNGNRKTYIYYQPNGVKKSFQETYYESNGNRKTHTRYQLDGTTINSSRCYDINGITKEACTMIKHGITNNSNKLIR